MHKRFEKQTNLETIIITTIMILLYFIINYNFMYKISINTFFFFLKYTHPLFVVLYFVAIKATTPTTAAATATIIIIMNEWVNEFDAKGWLLKCLPSKLFVVSAGCLSSFCIQKIFYFFCLTIFQRVCICCCVWWLLWWWWCCISRPTGSYSA